jgi:hypothetical protein
MTHTTFKIGDYVTGNGFYIGSGRIVSIKGDTATLETPYWPHREYALLSCLKLDRRNHPPT